MTSAPNRTTGLKPFKKVIWATDGSAAADIALPYAGAIASGSGAPLLVVYCQEFTTPAQRGPSVPVHVDDDDLRAKIEGQVTALSNQGLNATFESVRSPVGGAAYAVADITAMEHADLIVVGTRGHTALGGLLLGSVTQRLVHIAPCPVLAVPTPR